MQSGSGISRWFLPVVLDASDLIKGYADAAVP